MRLLLENEARETSRQQVHFTSHSGSWGSLLCCCCDLVVS